MIEAVSLKNRQKKLFLVLGKQAVHEAGSFTEVKFVNDSITRIPLTR